MNKHLIVSGIAVLLICVVLSGCTEKQGMNETDKFIGTWTETLTGEPFDTGILSGLEVTFYENRTGNSSAIAFPTYFNYYAKDRTLYISGNEGSNITYYYEFSDDVTSFSIKINEEQDAFAIYNKTIR